jgi:hypothetical protein
VSPAGFTHVWFIRENVNPFASLNVPVHPDATLQALPAIFPRRAARKFAYRLTFTHLRLFILFA